MQPLLEKLLAIPKIIKYLLFESQQKKEKKKKRIDMKKLTLILLTLILVTSCDVEPIDPALTNGGGNDGGGSESADLTMSLYELDTNITIDFFGAPLESITKSDIVISNNKITSATNAFSLSGSPFVNENQVFTRNASGQIISDISMNSSGVVTNEYLITYTNGVISNITYDYYEDDVDDFNYNFTYDGNTITRTEAGSSISTVFTVDGSDRIIKKESFENGLSIQSETVAYGANGNITSSLLIGETQSNTIFEFDNNMNPLKAIYQNNYLLRFLSDNYEDEIGQSIAQFSSTNNWKGAVINGNAFNFTLTYNSVGRIETRDIAYSFGPELSFVINEKFSYVN